MNTFSISALITGFFSLGLGIYVYLRSSKKHMSKLWFFLTLCIAIWSFGLGMMVLSHNYEEALLWARFLHIGAIFIPIVYLHFILALLQDTTKRKIIFWGYILGTIFLVLDSTNLLVKDLGPILSFKYYPVAGTMYPYFTLMFFGYVGYALSRLIKAQRISSGLKQRQLNLCFASISYRILWGFNEFRTSFSYRNLPLREFPCHRLCCHNYICHY